MVATVAPSGTRVAAWLAVRSHARTAKPARAKLAPIGPPIRPVPRNAITGRAVRRLWSGWAGVICPAVSWLVMAFLSA